MSTPGVPQSRTALHKRQHYLVGVSFGLLPIILWFVVALDPLQRHDLFGVVIALLQAEVLAALACLLVIRRMRPVAYGLLTPLPLSVFLLLAL